MQPQIETRFVELMTELFQMDEAQALDFGIYRVIRRHNNVVKAFLGEILTDKNSKVLQGGRLAELLDAAFESMGHEAQAEDKFRLKDLEQQLGLKPGDTQQQREAKLTQAENIPATNGLVTEYRSRTEINGSGTFVRVQALEQYDDTLESLDADISTGNSGELHFQDAAFALRYRLDANTRALYCGVDRFSTPFGYLRPDANGQHGTWAARNRRLQLMDYALDGKWGLGSEKASDIRDHPAPCSELWKRKKNNSKK